MSTVAYPKNQESVFSSVEIICSANTPEYTNIPGVMINPEISTEVLNASPKHRKIVDGVIVLKTDEEIAAMDTRTPAEKREEAYASKCDPMLPTLMSYQLTNDSRYETIKAEWETKRTEIQALYPDA